MISRRLMASSARPLPGGDSAVTFCTRFANEKENAVESVALAREDGTSRVAGVTIG